MMGYRLYVARTRLLGVVKPKDFVKHLLLFGPTGSGKTSTSMKAVELALRKGSEAVIIDWKGEYASYFNGATTIRKLDLLKPEYVDYETHSLVVVDILRDVLELSDPMSYLLYDELIRGYKTYGDSLTFTKLIKSIEVRRASALASRAIAEANIAEALVRRLYLLALDEKRAAKNTIGSERVVVYDLSALPTYQLRCMYAEMILWRLYNAIRASGSPVKRPALARLLVLEEAQNYIRPRRPEKTPSIGERIVNELRAYGVGALIISPDPGQLPYHMARDTGAVVSIGYQGLPEVVAELLSFYRYSDIKKLIKTTGRMRTYIYYRGKLYIKGVPKPYKKLIDLGVSTREEVTAVEEVKAEEGPSGGAFTLA
jgi:DNA polymerase III delta prime subunit